MTDHPKSPGGPLAGFAPCSLCKQYSHSIGDDQLAKAFMHFQSMIAHPVRGHPMGDAFDEQTRDAAQVLMAAAQRYSVLGRSALALVSELDANETPLRPAEHEAAKRVRAALASPEPVGYADEGVVEKVARAIAEYRYRPGYHWAIMFESERNFLRGEARAAIAALGLGERHDG